jgi:hypothetical protein
VQQREAPALVTERRARSISLSFEMKDIPTIPRMEDSTYSTRLRKGANCADMMGVPIKPKRMLNAKSAGQIPKCAVVQKHKMNILFRTPIWKKMVPWGCELFCLKVLYTCQNRAIFGKH